MKVIYKIAGQELKSLFYSPIAWLILVIFIFQTGIVYAGLMENVLTWRKSGMDANLVTAGVFSRPIVGFFVSVIGNLYLYIPLLTMGSMSRELSSGSIKLLYSSPVKISEIVLGKFLGIMAFNFLFAVVMVLFGVYSATAIVHMDYKLVLTGIFGIYLLICTYAAIGLFISSLTSYQVIAALGTLMVLGAINFLGSVGQDYEIVRNVTHFLAMPGRIGMFTDGLVSTQNLFYFILFILLFLTLTYLKILGGRESKPVRVKTIRYLTAISCSIFLFYVTSRPQYIGYYDATATKSNTLTSYSQAILAKIKEPVTITAYSNILDPYYSKVFGAPEYRNADYDYWERYRRFLPNLKLKYVDYYDTSNFKYMWSAKENAGLNVKQLAVKLSDAADRDITDFLSPEEIKKQINLDPEEHQYVRRITMGNKSAFLRVYQDNPPWPYEREIMAAFKSVVEGPAKVYFLTGHNERKFNGEGDKDYRQMLAKIDFRFALINQGFVFDSLTLNEQDVPKDADVLVIADPRKALQSTGVQKINQFISNGGNLLIAAEPRKQVMLDSILSPLGVHLIDGELIQNNRDAEPNLLVSYFASGAKDFSARYYEEPHADSAFITLPGAMGIRFDTNGIFQKKPILVVRGSNTWNKVANLSTDTGKLSFNSEQGDTRFSGTVALGLFRKLKGKDQRIMVISDADWPTSFEISRRKPVTPSNLYFAEEAFKWLTSTKYPLVDLAPSGVRRPKSADSEIKIDKKDIGNLKIIFMGLIPGVIIIFAAIFLIKRRRK